jgi:hypothetical protein
LGRTLVGRVGSEVADSQKHNDLLEFLTKFESFTSWETPQLSFNDFVCFSDPEVHAFSKAHAMRSLILGKATSRFKLTYKDRIALCIGKLDNIFETVHAGIIANVKGKLGGIIQSQMDIFSAPESDPANSAQRVQSTTELWNAAIGHVASLSCPGNYFGGCLNSQTASPLASRPHARLSQCSGFRIS